MPKRNSKKLSVQDYFTYCSIAFSILLSIIVISRVIDRALPDMYFFYAIRNITYSLSGVIIYWIWRFYLPDYFLVLEKTKKHPKRQKKQILLIILVYLGFFSYYKNDKSWSVYQQRLNELLDAAPDLFSDGFGWLRLGSECNYVLSGLDVCKNYIYPKAAIFLGTFMDKIEVQGVRGYPLFVLVTFLIFILLCYQKISNQFQSNGILFLILLSPPVIFVIDRTNLDYLIAALTACSLIYLKLCIERKNKLDYVAFILLFELAILLKIYPLLLAPIIFLKLHGERRLFFAVVTLLNVIYGIQTGWIYSFQNSPEPTLQGSGLTNLFKIWSGDYTYSLLNSNQSLVLRSIFYLGMLIISNKLLERLNSPGMFMILLCVFIWIVGINFTYKNIFLVLGILLLMLEGKSIIDIKNSFLVFVVTTNIFLGKADILVNSVNLFLLIYIALGVIKLRKSVYEFL